MIYLLTLFFLFLASFILTWIFKNYSIKHNVIDIPNKRSSHIKPTPRGGGISVVIIFFLSLIYYGGILREIDNDLFFSILIGGSIISFIGFIDDHRDIPAKWRFIIHIFAALLSLKLLTVLSSIYIFSVNISLIYLLYFIYSITLVWLLNLYNFMDGIDGIASIEAITVLLSAALIIFLQGDSSTPHLLLLLASCVFGFLIWNWPPAKIFMGDACSGFLGFTIGLMAIATSNSDAINLWSWLILLAVFVVDATYTLIFRFVRRVKWYEAHRSHAYQILSRQYRSHKKVTLGILIINIVWLLPLAYLAALYEYWAPVLALIAISPLVIIDYKIGAGIRND